MNRRSLLTGLAASIVAPTLPIKALGGEIMRHAFPAGPLYAQIENEVIMVAEGGTITCALEEFTSNHIGLFFLGDPDELVA